MATKKISTLNPAAALAGTEELPVVQSGATVKATITQVGTRIQAQLGFSAFGLTIIDDADAAAVRTTIGAFATAGGTFSGAVQFPAGSVSAPSIAINESNSGLYEIDGDSKGFAVDGVLMTSWHSNSGNPIFLVSKDVTAPYALTGQTPCLQVIGTGASTSTTFNARWSANSSGPGHVFYKSRGSVGGVGIVSSGDNCGNITWRADDGSTPDANVAVIGAAVDGTPGTGDMPGRIMFSTSPDGSSTVVERLRIDNAGALIHRNNAQQIVDADSHIQLRSYTVGTLPSAATAGQLIYVSDGTSNKRLAVSDGTNWRFPDGNVVS